MTIPMLGPSQKKIKAFWRFQALLAPATLGEHNRGLINARLDTIQLLRHQITFMPSAAQRCIEVQRPFANHNKNPDFSGYHANFLLW